MEGSGADATSMPVTTSTEIEDHSDGLTSMFTMIVENVTSDENVTSNGGGAPQFSGLQGVVEIILYIVLAIGMFGIGCGVDLRKVWEHCKKPTGAIIGVTCQFVIMPLTAFILALILQMSSIRTLMLLILGSCPGGSISNIAVVWVDGDLDLSACMTAISCVLAFGMMPLLLFIYSFAFADNIEVPFESIGITLVIVVVPMSIGSLFKTKWPRIAAILLKVLSGLGILAVIVLIVLALVTYGRIFSIVIGQVIASIILPFCGLLLGYGLSSLIGLYRPFRLGHKQRRTVAIETGIQNAQLALGIISLSDFSLLEQAQVILFPVLYLTGQAVWILILIAAWKIYRRRHPIPEGAEELSQEGDEKSKDKELSAEFSNPAFDNDEPPPDYSEVEENVSTAF